MIVLLLACIGTTKDTGDDSTPVEDEMLQRDSYVDSSNRNGVIDVSVEVGDETTAFMVTVESDYYPVLEYVYGPDGDTVLDWEDWTYSDESLTYAFFWSAQSMAFNWPAREQDGPLTPGSWTVSVAMVDDRGYYANNVDAEVTIHRKDDTDLDLSEVQVRLVWAEGEGEDPDVVAATEAAVERWREVWSMYGVTLVESWHDSELSANLGFADSGSSKVEENAERFDGREIIMVIGESISGAADTYGIAGGIPGSIEPNINSHVTIAWLAHAGTNGNFSEDEIRLMGETMAHEAGHYMGLFHPVEWNYDAWDALDDTEDCSTWQSCENKLGENLMFPYPICDWTSCEPQPDLTGQQVGVSQRYIGAL